MPSFATGHARLCWTDESETSAEQQGRGVASHTVSVRCRQQPEECQNRREEVTVVLRRRCNRDNAIAVKCGEGSCDTTVPVLLTWTKTTQCGCPSRTVCSTPQCIPDCVVCRALSELITWAANVDAVVPSWRACTGGHEGGGVVIGDSHVSVLLQNTETQVVTSRLAPGPWSQ